MTRTQSILFTAALATATLAHADILFYDGCPDGTGAYALSDKGGDIKDTKPAHTDIIGFDTNYWASKSGVLKAYTSTLAFPESFGATQKSHQGNGKFGLVQAGTTKDMPRVQVRKFTTSLTLENIPSVESVYFRVLLSTDQTALNTLTAAEGLTDKNTRGVGILAFTKLSNQYLMMPSQTDRFVWLGINSHSSGKGSVECSIKGLGGAVVTATLIDEITAGATYIVCAKIDVNAEGAETVTAFAQPVVGYNRNAAWVAVGSADLIDNTNSALDCLAFGGEYQTNNGGVYFDEFCGATTLEEALDWSEEETPYISSAAFSGNPAEGLSASMTLANAPATATVKLYAGTTEESLSGAAIQTWNSTDGASSWTYNFPSSVWGETYYAKWTVEYGESGSLEATLTPYVAQATLVWTGGAGLWNNADNWSPEAVPNLVLDTAFTNGEASVSASGTGLAAKSLAVSNGAKAAIELASDADLTLGSLSLSSGKSNGLSVKGGTLAVTGALTFGVQSDISATANGNALTFADGNVSFGTINLYGSVWTTMNNLLFTNATVVVAGITDFQKNEQKGGNVRFTAKDSDFTFNGHIEVEGTREMILFEDSVVQNNGILRMGNSNSTTNELRLAGTTWTQTAYEIIVGRLGSQRLEVGTGSSLTLAGNVSRAEAGNIYLGRGSNVSGLGTLIVSNSTVNVAKNVYAPLEVVYGPQTVKLFEDDGLTTRLSCVDFYVGSTSLRNDVPSKTIRTTAEASSLSMDGGTIACSGTLSIGAKYETGGNTFNVAGATAHCTAQLFSLTNASVMNVTIPATGFTNSALIETTGKADISGDSRVNIDASAFKSGTVTLVQGNPVAVDEEAIDTIFTITEAANPKGSIRLVKDGLGNIIKIQYRAPAIGFTVIVR